MTMKLTLKSLTKTTLLEMLEEEKKAKGELEEKLSTFKGMEIMLDEREVGLLLEKIMGYLSDKVFNLMHYRVSLPLMYALLPVEENPEGKIPISKEKATAFFDTIQSINSFKTISMTIDGASYEEAEKEHLKIGEYMAELIQGRDRKTKILFLQKKVARLCYLINEMLYMVCYCNVKSRTDEFLRHRAMIS